MVTKEQALMEVGLNDKEIKIYLSCLMLGQSSVNTIAKKANLNRVSSYDILKGLLTKGFVSYVIKSGVKYFEAVEPSKFLDELKEKQAKIKQVLPELEFLKASFLEKPQIGVYEDINGLKSIFNDILKENKEAWFIGAPKMLEVLEFYFPHFIKQKRKQGIFSKVITTDCKEMREYKRKTSKKYINMKFINNKIEVTKIIYGNKIAYLTFNKENSIGILIDNQEITDFERIIFNILWKSSN